jgi:Family of unknown function (DUF6298)
MILKKSPAQRASIAGLLVVSKVNPRYFTLASGDAADQPVVYLTGSHIWNNFHDGFGPGLECAETPEVFDYDAYLAFLRDHGHNFIRLWRWEHFKSQFANFHLCMMPQPWPRTGSGTAKDGQAKFDLSKFDPAYFERLRSRIVAAGNEGIYVAVMFFEGFCLHVSPAPDKVEGHPFHAGNNVNDIGITSITDYQVLPLNPRIQALQEAYIRKVVDTVHDLSNVLYEVANESSGDPTKKEVGDSTEWQYWVINLVKQYEQEKGYDKHPIGMTMQFPVRDQNKVNDPLFDGPADWISPGGPVIGKNGMPSGPGKQLTDPSASDGTKVVISDTDHYAPGKGDALWAWKTFLRGQHSILMDFGLISGPNPPSPSAGPAHYKSFEPARYAMGDTLRYAQKMKLVEMKPQGDLSSTGYALANAATEYLILQPSERIGWARRAWGRLGYFVFRIRGSDPFTVKLAVGAYAVDWYCVNTRRTADAGTLTVQSPAPTSFNAPFAPAGPAVLHLKRFGA